MLLSELATARGTVNALNNTVGFERGSVVRNAVLVPGNAVLVKATRDWCRNFGMAAACALHLVSGA